jgi:hypothetical protein
MIKDKRTMSAAWNSNGEWLESIAMKSSMLLHLFMLLSQLVHSQDLHKIDSLKLLLKDSDHPANVLNQISEAYMRNAPEKTLEYAEIAFHRAYQAEDDENRLRYQEIKATPYMLQGNYNEALSLLNSVAGRAEETGVKSIYLTSFIQIGRMQRAKGNSAEAPDF